MFRTLELHTAVSRAFHHAAARAAGGGGFPARHPAHSSGTRKGALPRANLSRSSATRPGTRRAAGTRTSPRHRASAPNPAGARRRAATIGASRTRRRAATFRTPEASPAATGGLSSRTRSRSVRDAGDGRGNRSGRGVRTCTTARTRLPRNRLLTRRCAS